jgi:upstream-binding transcription factor
LEKEEEEHKKILKQEALQLLKKKQKADNIIKVSPKVPHEIHLQ